MKRSTFSLLLDLYIGGHKRLSRWQYLRLRIRRSRSEILYLEALRMRRSIKRGKELFAAEIMKPNPLLALIPKSDGWNYSEPFRPFGEE